MGYRSQVVLAVAPEAASAFMALCAKDPKVLEFCHKADTFTSGYAREGDYFMFWDHIKWYEGYPEVEAIQAFVLALEDDDLSDYGESEPPKRPDGSDDQWGEYFRFVRLGEDTDDLTEKGWAFDGIGVTRSLYF